MSVLPAASAARRSSIMNWIIRPLQTERYSLTMQKWRGALNLTLMRDRTTQSLPAGAQKRKFQQKELQGPREHSQQVAHAGRRSADAYVHALAQSLIDFQSTNNQTYEPTDTCSRDPHLIIDAACAALPAGSSAPGSRGTVMMQQLALPWS